MEAAPGAAGPPAAELRIDVDAGVTALHAAVQARCIAAVCTRSSTVPAGESACIMHLWHAWPCMVLMSCAQHPHGVVPAWLAAVYLRVRMRAQAGAGTVAECLLQNVAHVDARDLHGCTPLHYAVILHQPWMICLLVHHQACRHASSMVTMTHTHAWQLRPL